MKNILERNNIEFQDSEKYYTACPKCNDERNVKDTKSLMVTADNGYVRWKCLHAEQCEWNKLQTYKVGGEVLDKVVEVKASQVLIEEGNIPPHPKDSILYNYKDIDGNTMFYVIRTKDKKFCPMTYTEDGEWTAKAWRQNSLYGAELLKDNDVVIVVEGEKTRDAAQKIFTKAAVVSWIGGAANIKKGDWALLEGKEIILWPDNDDAGIKAMKQIASVLSKENVSLVDVVSLPPKYDLADDIDRDTISKLYEMRKVQVKDCIPNSISKDLFLDNMSKVATGIGLGFDNMDKTLRLPQSGLTIIAGRSGHGKTTMMLNMAVNMLQQTDKKIVYYSYEIPGARMLMKLLMCWEGIQLDPIPHKNEEKYRELLLNDDLKSWLKVLPLLDNKLFMTDQPADIDELVRTLDTCTFEDSVVFIDYIQLIPSKDGKQSRYLTIKESADKLRAVANKRNLVVVTGSQLTDGETPYQDSVREGKDIQNAAELVLKIWNKRCAEASAIMKTKKVSKEDGGGEEQVHYYDQVEGDFVIDVMKNRNGEPGRKYGFKLKFGTKLEEVDVDTKFENF